MSFPVRRKFPFDFDRFQFSQSHFLRSVDYNWQEWRGRGLGRVTNSHRVTVLYLRMETSLVGKGKGEMTGAKELPIGVGNQLSS